VRSLESVMSQIYAVLAKQYNFVNSALSRAPDWDMLKPVVAKRYSVSNREEAGGWENLKARSRVDFRANKKKDEE